MDPSLPRVEADPRRLEQVFANLLSNAVKFTDEGGAIEVAAGHETVGTTSEVYVRVKDSGVGIHPEELKRLFEKYRQTTSGKASANKGTGLGLVISKMIVEAHGGRISVHSKPGKGSAFTFTIPCKNKKEDISKKTSASYENNQ
jgi:signal transduction histidine kinase